MEDEFRNYTIDYQFNGGTWSISVPAKDRADALERLLAIHRTSVVFGYDKRIAKSSGNVPAFAT